MRYVKFLGSAAQNLFGSKTGASFKLSPDEIIAVDDDDAAAWVQAGLVEYAEREQELTALGLVDTSAAAKALDAMGRAELLDTLDAAGEVLGSITGTGTGGYVTNDDIREYLLPLLPLEP